MSASNSSENKLTLFGRLWNISSISAPDADTESKQPSLDPLISLPTATSSKQHITINSIQARKRKRKRALNDHLYGHKNKKQKIGKTNKIKTGHNSQNPICIDSDSDDNQDIDIKSQPNIKILKISNNIIYKSSDRVLFIGEMDFSLSASISKAIGAYYFVCTSYYTQITKEFNVNDANFMKTANDNINSLKYNGASIMFGVDGTKLDNYCFKLSWGHNRMITKFDKIIFGYPYCTFARQKSKKKANQLFMSNIFKSTKNFLKENGEFHVILIRKQIKVWNINYDDWNMTKMKKITKLSEFNDMFPGYTPRDTKGFQWEPEPSALFVFQPK